MVAVARPILDRFVPKYEVDDDGCWLWTAAIDKSGYGRIGRGSDVLYAHRVAYELAVGPIPEGLHLDHLCRVRHCVNPDHLEPVTNEENIRRGGNGMKTHCKNGHAFTADNTYVPAKRPTQRHCLTCERERDKRRVR